MNSLNTVCSEQLAISVKDVTVEYKIFEYKVTTLKEYFIRKLKGLHSFTRFQALKNVSLEIYKGESVALLGHNGSGKSTLLKVIAGIIEPPNTSIVCNGRIAPMIELGAGFDPELSGYENVRLSCMIMGLTSSEVDARIEGIVKFADIHRFMNVPVKNYSSGMQARLGFACATAVEPDILLVDEVLSVGDSNFSKKCLSRIQELREKGTTVVLVSHSSDTVKQFCTRGYVLREGELMYNGSIDDAVYFHEKIMSEINS